MPWRLGNTAIKIYCSDDEPLAILSLIGQVQTLNTRNDVPYLATELTGQYMSHYELHKVKYPSSTLSVSRAQKVSYMQSDGQ